MGTMNPDKNSWVLNWVHWYLDKDGYPDPKKNGVKRYVLINESKPIFADTAEELIEKYPHLCYQQNPKTGEMTLIPPKSIACFFATIYDNPALMESQPEYLASLKAQTDINRARLLDGNWFADVEGASYFERNWVRNVSYRDLPKNIKWVRAYDKASTEPTESNRYPDFTASILMGRCRDGNTYILGDWIDRFKDDDSPIYGRFRKRAGIRDQIIEEQAEHDGKSVTVILPKDPSSAGAVEYQASAKKLNNAGFLCKPDPTPNNKSKLVRFTPFSSACQNGSVFIVEDSFPNRETLEHFYVELEQFNGERSTATRKDDLPDACASGFNALAKERIAGVVHTPQVNAPTIKSKSKLGSTNRSNFNGFGKVGIFKR